MGYDSIFSELSPAVSDTAGNTHPEMGCFENSCYACLD